MRKHFRNDVLRQVALLGVMLAAVRTLERPLVLVASDVAPEIAGQLTVCRRAVSALPGGHRTCSGTDRSGV